MPGDRFTWGAADLALMSPHAARRGLAQVNRVSSRVDILGPSQPFPQRVAAAPDNSLYTSGAEVVPFHGSPQTPAG
jgi:hypothetical protein